MTRKDCLAAAMVGERYGSLVVLAVAESSRFPGGSLASKVECRCDCGSVFLVLASHVRSGQTSCRRCGFERSNRHNREVRSLRLPSGKTIAQLAHDTGIKLNTLYVRWVRGWPEERLAQATMKRGAR